MRAREGLLVVVGALLVLTSGRRVGANPLVVDYQLLDNQGRLQHVVPREATGVRMLQERVLLIPFYDQSKQPLVLVHAWYDLVSEKAHQALPVGFPEVKGIHRRSMLENMGFASQWSLRTNMPTIVRFSATLEGRFLRVRSHPGVGLYRRWFTFGVRMPAGKRVRLHTRYISRLGRHIRYDYSSGMGMPENPGHEKKTVAYWIDYVLHTGAKWRGPIGKGLVALYTGGTTHPLKRFTNLTPTAKDDIAVQLDLARLHVPEEMAQKATADWTRQVSILRDWLVQQSSYQRSKEVSGLGAFAVDGDEQTAWISAAGKGVGGWLQLPGDGRRTLQSLTLRSATTAGVARPAELKVICRGRLKGRYRTRALAGAKLPDSAGPHRIQLKPSQGCEAVRITVVAVHGDATRPVGIAEVTQHYKTPARRPPPVIKKVLSCCTKPVALLTRTLARWRRALGKIPVRHRRPGHEIGQVSRVRWSADGTMVHYHLRLENELHTAHAALLGVVVDVASGKVVLRYRLDRVGKLPAPLEKQWLAAQPFHRGAALLERHRFLPADVRGPAAKGASPVVQLHATLVPRSGQLRTARGRSGFRWWFLPADATSTAQESRADLRLVVTGPDGKPRTLAQHRPALDGALALAHQRVRRRRLKVLRGKVRENTEDHGEQKARATGRRLLRYLFPREHAFSGEVTLHYHPTAKAVVAVWRDVRELTSLLPDKIISWPNVEKVTPWGQLDYGRVRVAVTVHALAPTNAAPLVASATSMSAAKPAVGNIQPKRDPQLPVMASAKTSSGKQSGCGCGTSHTTTIPLAALVLLWMLAYARCRPT